MKGIFRLFRNDENGGVIIVFALILPIFFLIMAAQINYGAAQLARVKMNNSVMSAHITTRTYAFSLLPLSQQQELVRDEVLVNIPVDANGKAVLYGNELKRSDIIYTYSPSKITITHKVKKFM